MKKKGGKNKGDYERKITQRQSMQWEAEHPRAQNV